MCGSPFRACTFDSGYQNNLVSSLSIAVLLFLSGYKALKPQEEKIVLVADSLQIAAIKVQNYDYSQLVTPTILR